MCATATLSIGLYAGPLMLLADRRTLYVHAMDLADGPDALRADVRDTLEGRVLPLLRGVAPDASTVDSSRS